MDGWMDCQRRKRWTRLLIELEQEKKVLPYLPTFPRRSFATFYEYKYWNDQVAGGGFQLLVT
jgi:hypothetical protein